MKSWTQQDNTFCLLLLPLGCVVAAVPQLHLRNQQSRPGCRARQCPFSIACRDLDVTGEKKGYRVLGEASACRINQLELRLR